MPSILLVDDDAPFRDVVCRVLRAAGHAVDQAPDGRQALKTIKAEAPDILITDIIMPDGDGIELIGVVRRDYPSIGILAISGRGNLGPMSVLKLAGSLGAHATLSKPLNGEEILEQVDRLIATKAERG